ncbi:MAG: ATPase, T2SS/T4P/T4SS family [Pseudomonadota bacterium]
MTIEATDLGLTDATDGASAGLPDAITAEEESFARPIGELLVAHGELSEADLAKGLAVQKEIGGLIGQALHRIGAVTEEVLLARLAQQLEMPVVTLRDLPEEPDGYTEARTALGISADWLINHRTALWFTGEPDSESRKLTIIAGDPLSAGLRERMASATAPGRPGDGISVTYALADNQTLDVALGHYQRAEEDKDDLGDEARLRELAEEAPVIDFVNNLFFGALKENASDIHIEAYELNAVVRYRIDGVLQERSKVARARFDAIASRIKLIGGMDIAERRLPQDGRCTVRFAGNDVDLRISAVPSTWGESLVIRLLRKQTELPDLAGLGLTGRTREVLQKILNLPNGVFLVTGPTGSGKSTTLYRGLELINDGERKIITIEDPVEYDIAGVTQIQVKSDIGYDFANGLRAILRQDPDVIMVGEIRDGETANIAAQAALTGHMVMSTLHTNSALAAITRLRDIGLEPFLIAAALRGIMAQRLVRRLCEHCSVPADGADGEHEIKAIGGDFAKRLSAEDGRASWRAPAGCEACGGTGYRGRVALSEIVEIEEAMRQAISEGAPSSRIFEIARAQGFESLYETGLRKARAGITTLSEVRRVCSGDYV